MDEKAGIKFKEADKKIGKISRETDRQRLGFGLF